MSVYIKGMEMPKGCAFCEIKRRLGKIMVCPFCNEEWDIHDPMSAEYRLAGCPLVPVPEHGRLIDADALIDAIIAKYIRHERNRELVFAAAEIKQDLADIISELPTIIPADKEGEG